MGLLTSVNNINYNMKAKEEERRKKELEKKKIQQKKDDLEQLKYDIINTIKFEMQENFNIYGSNTKIFYYSIDNKSKMLENILNNYAEDSKFGKIIRNKREIIEIFEKNYYKILNELEKAYKKNDQYLEYMAIAEAENEAEPIQQQKNYLPIILLIIKILACIVFFPIVFLGLLVYAGLKSVN